MKIEFVPSARGLALLAGASLLFLVSVPAALLADAAILWLIWLDASRVRPPRASRTPPRISALATVSEVKVRVDNPAARAALALVTDDLDACLRRLPDGADEDEWERGKRVELPAGGSVDLVYRMEPRTRGHLTLGDIHLRTLGRLGLAWRRSRTPASHTLRVQPGIEDLLRDRSAHALKRLRAPGQRRVRLWGEGREFESLRDYARGDDPRTIDWKATARRRKHVVRNYEAERSQNIVIAIDSGRLMRERLSTKRERIDYALAASMMLASRAQRYGDRVGLMVFDDRIRHISPPRRVKPAAMAAVLAGAETSTAEPNYPMAFATLGRTFRKRSLVVLFCDVVDGAVSRALTASFARTTRGHLPLAVAIRNPMLEEAAARPVARKAAAYRRAAAEELLQARRDALTVMRRTGILVVDTLPGEALVNTLDKYVEIKERGLL